MLHSALHNFYERIEGFFSAGRLFAYRYRVAVGVFGLATIWHFILEAAFSSGSILILYLPATLFAAWCGGLEAGLFTTSLGTAASLLLLAHKNGAWMLTQQQMVNLLIFLVCCGVGSLLLDFLHYLLGKQRRLHEEVFQQREWFKVTLSSIGDAVIVTNEQGLTTFMNAEAERLTGWTAVESKNKPLKEIFIIKNEDSSLILADPAEMVLAQKKSLSLPKQTILVARDGTSCPVEDRAAPIYNRGKEIVGVVLVFQDASELRAAQRALLTHAQELEKQVQERTLALQRSVGELEAFSYTVSHDLRAPLRAMQGYALSLLEDYANDWPKEAQDYLQRITRAAERLDRLIKDLLNYGRLTEEESTVMPVDLDKLVRDLLEQDPELSQQVSHIAIETKLPVVLGHESALIQVLSNLLGNALKFVKAGETPRVRVWGERKSNRLRLWVEDQGIGIAPGNHERIYKMFEQVNSTKAYSGTGIGLALVKKAVERMQGSSGVDSAEGEGSRFWIELRLADLSLPGPISAP